MSEQAVIVGAGVAGHCAADSMRDAGFEGAISILGAEPLRPYDRPALSKEILRGERAVEDLPLWAEERYRALDVELLLSTRASSIDSATRTVTTSQGERLPFDRLLIATGAEPIVPQQPGFDKQGVVTLRTAVDARALRALFLDRPRVGIVGAGFVGTEVAASAREAGCEVALIDALPGPLHRVLGADLSATLAALHEAHGVRLHMRATVERILGHSHAEAIVLHDRSVLECDLVVLAVGVRPETELAAQAGLSTEDGILVDDTCQTGVPGIYAAGDVALWRHPLSPGPIRVEHFDNAVAQGAAAGRSMAGRPESYAPIPSFWSDQYEHTLLWTGFPGDCGEVIVRRGGQSMDLTAYYLSERRVRAVASFAGPRSIRVARQLIMQGRSVDLSTLAPPDLDPATGSAIATAMSGVPC